MRAARLSFWYADATEPALRDVDLAVAPGELLVLCGPSGGGKSTLLRACQGIVPQLTGGGLSGEIEVLGIDATSTRPYELAARGVTIVYQNALEGFVADRVADEVAFGPESLGLAAGDVVARVDAALSDVGLGRSARRRIATLSGGEQQRVAIAAALALAPRVLLLDEPTAHLDENTAAEIVSLLDRLRRERDITLLLAEHRLGLVAPIADRVAVIAGGRLHALGAPRDVLADPALVGLGVAVPRATQAAVRLGVAGVPLTPAELADALAPRTPKVAVTGTHGGAGAQHAAARAVSSSPVALGFERVSFRYPGAEHDALSDVTLRLGRGERVALVGPSGAGKSTLARLALGLARPAAGEVTVLGARAPTVAALTPRVGLVVQNPMHQLLAESVEGEIALGLRHLPGGARRARIQQVLDRFRLTELRLRHPLSLAEGQRRRVALAAAIAPGPELLVMDEPTLAQDETQRVALASLVHELGDAGVAVLAITHDREFVNDACERVIRLADGRIGADLPLAGAADGIARLADAAVALADVPATVLALTGRDRLVGARTVDDLMGAYG